MAAQAAITVRAEAGHRASQASSDGTAAGRDSWPDSPFIGRLRELSVLEATLRAANRGWGAIVLLAGEPGIGKTRLAEQMAESARALGFAIAWGRCWEGDGAPSFWPWIQILRDCQPETSNRHERGVQFPEIGRVLQDLGIPVPEAPAPASEHSRFWLFDVVFSLVRRAAASRPLLVVLDDLQWADPASLLVLQFVAAEMRSVSLVVVGTYRDVDMMPGGPLSQALSSASRHPWSRRLGLHGLSGVEVRQFIERSTRARAPDRVVRTFTELTGGNPFFLTEAVRLLGDEGSQADRGGGTIRQFPDTVREAVERRLKTLPIRSARLLRHASVIGQEFDTELLGMQTGQTADEVRSALAQAVSAKLVMPLLEQAGRYRFGHALVRQFLYAQVPAGQRQRWHARLASTLEKARASGLEPPIAPIAYHFAMAGSAGDPEKALEYSSRAGDQAAAALAYEDAASHYRRALDCPGACGLDGARRCELLLSLGEAQKRSGDWEGSRDTFRQAADVARRLAAPIFLARAAIGFRAFIGRVPVDQEAVALLREALFAVGAGDSGVRVQLLAALTFSLHFDPDQAMTIDLGAEAMTIARRLGEPVLVADALEAHVYTLFGRCGAREFADLATEAVQLAERSTDHARVFRCRILRYAALLQNGHCRAAEEELRGCAGLAKELRYPKYLWQVGLAEAGRAVASGQFSIAQQLIEEGQRAGQDFDGPTADQYRIIQQTTLLYARGEIGTAESALRKVVEAYPDVALGYAALANACVEMKRVREAREALEWFGWSELQGIPGILVLYTLALAAEAASALPDEPRARVLYRLLAPHAHENVLVSWGVGLVGSVSHYLGVLAGSLGEFDQAARHFEEALAMNAHMRAPVLVASTQRRYAEMLLSRDRDGDHGRAKELMHRAITTFERLQMSGHLEAAKGTLGHLGGGAKTPAGGALAPDAHVDDPEATRGAPDLYVFRREGDFWTIVFAGTVLRLRHTRGLALLSLLLQRPDAEMHVLDLVGALAGGLLVDGDPGHKRCGRRPRNELEGIQGDAGPLIDVRARQEYRRRVEELRSELAEAEGFNDIGRASTLRAEIEQLTGELKRAYGTNGPRMAASATERARVSVRNNISNTLNILRRLDQNLWRHLDAAVRTGTYCSYRPERAIPWTF